MRHPIRHSNPNRGYTDHYDIRRQLGLDPNKHLPKEGLPVQIIQGVRVWIVPLGTQQIRKNGTAVKSSMHRVLCECPSCGKTVSVGRMHQHKCLV